MIAVGSKVHIIGYESKGLPQGTVLEIVAFDPDDDASQSFAIVNWPGAPDGEDPPTPAALLADLTEAP